MTMISSVARVGHGRVREGRERRLVECNGVAKPALFSLGRLFATPVALAALEALSHEGKPYSVRVYADDAKRLELVMPFVARHAAGDWGDINEADKRANDEALQAGDRIMSGYQLPDGNRLWILTEADRSATTVILAHEY